ncbi:VanZ family protein [Aromatoleum buckelii]|uniref:VanZ family protein n=1 Tax=Aromatoleum buckelii TaxID=200254 RepID=A0ABX1N7S0_9RHOO|nr:VanZ family protein [Aromatoleum buckelii]MCK0512736.1 VanZ family protein [Aromatoleum buckelii]
MKPGAGTSGRAAAGGELVWRFVALAIVVALFAGGRHTPAVAGLIALPWDKLMHATTFGVLALSLVRGFSLPLVWVGLTAALFGVADELHQTTLPGRDPSVGDWVADLVGVALVLTWLWWRHRASCTNRS